MRQKLGPMLFAQEFEGEFIDAESSAFSSELIELPLVDDFEVHSMTPFPIFEVGHLERVPLGLSLLGRP